VGKNGFLLQKIDGFVALIHKKVEDAEVLLETELLFIDLIIRLRHEVFIR
jgi:hypothetical protein